MNIIEIIEKKKQGLVLAREEIEYFVSGYVKGAIPDYQISALLMAVYFQGMTPEETFDLTISMVNSGVGIDLSSLPGITADKHSTGGIGDKVTLILAPLWAATGLTVAKMSGRGLGHTGGTIDKLESIPGFNPYLTGEEFLSLAKINGIAITGQSQDLVPADRLIYALRDVTATVDSIPLIASSVMSKKLATGCNILVLDVKYGRGAFMNTIERAGELARAMVEIGVKAGRKVAAVLSPMDHPLGMAVGNSLEVLEALDVLSGTGDKHLKNGVMTMAAVGYCLGGLSPDLNAGVKKARKALEDGSALKAFYKFIEGQGCTVAPGRLRDCLPVAAHSLEIQASQAGYINDIDSLSIGLASMDLGAGRKELTDKIHYGAGILLRHRVGDYVHKGDTLAVVYGDNQDLAREAQRVTEAFTIESKLLVQTQATRLVYNGVVKDITKICEID